MKSRHHQTRVMHVRRPQRRLITFCKYPEAGRVKTRLGRTIGNPEAAAVARELAELTFRRMRFRPRDAIHRILYTDPPGCHDRFRRWIGPGWILREQPPGDLGQRLEKAFTGGCPGRCTATVVIGTDCPGIRKHHVLAAFDALTKGTIVVGPTADGGFYLLGAQRLPADFFGNIPWSSEVTLRELAARAQRSGFRIRRLPALYDIDTEEDLKHWRNGRQSP